MRKSVYICFFVCSYILQLSYLYAQQISGYDFKFENREKQYGGLLNFHQYTVDDGLSQSQVNDIFEDSRGYLWFATQGGGICRFDGSKFYQYEEKDGIAGQIVNCIAEDQEGKMWFGSTWGGLTSYNGRVFHSFTRENGLLDNQVKAIFSDEPENRLLIGTSEGLNQYSGGNFGLVDLGLKTAVNNIVYVNQEYLLATAAGLLRMRDGKVNTVPLSEGVIHQSLTLDTLNQVLWAVTGEGLRCYSLNGFQLLNPFDGLADFPVHAVSCVHIDRNNDIWIGTNLLGLYLIRQNRIFHFDKNDGFDAENIETIFTDMHNRIWIGTSGNGVYCFNGFAFRYYFNLEGFGNSDIFAIAKDKESRIWVGTGNEGVFCYNGKTVVHYDTKNGMAGNIVRGISVARNGNIWFATDGGLTVRTGDRFVSYHQKDGLPTDNIRSVLVDTSGSVWIGTAGAGLAVYDGFRFISYKNSAGTGLDVIHCIFQDSRGDIWIGTGSGLHKFSNGKFVSYGDKNAGLCNTYVGNIVEDAFGNIWVGTDRCIAKFNGRKFTNYSVEDGLTSGTVYLMTVDHDGNLIVGTNKGFDKISFSSYGQITSITNYSRSEGFLGTECNSRAVLCDDEGLIWFGTIKGLIRYDPKEEEERFLPPQTFITSVKIFYDEKWMKNLKLPQQNWYGVPDHFAFRHDQNTISFSFEGVSTDYPDKIIYSYLLRGFDKDWSPVTVASTASYSNLPPGEYVFQVKAKGITGGWSTPAVFRFTIQPAFWQTWWFAGLIVILIIYIIYYVNTLLQQGVMRRNELLEEKVSVRTNELLKQKEEKDVLLKEIHHRVKNNMQVIVSLLNIHADYIKDPQSQALIEDSKSRIRSMALIHEKLYESRNFSKINIGEYLDSLVEELVATYGISTNVTIDKKIESVSFGFDTIIPLGLLLNEIVSNSLKYAFKDRTEGVIFFHLKANEKNYELMVGDNGVGMNPEIFNIPGKTIGVDLIRILVEQLNGTIELLDGTGTVYKISFESIDKKRI